jgi:hypothetical protein
MEDQMNTMTYDTRPASSTTSRVLLGAVLAAWFALAAAAGMSGILTAGPDTLARPVLLSVAIPMAGFFGLYAGSSNFRRYILTRDIRFLTMLQSWRVIGFGFLLLYASGSLPALFAWPAGVGDFLIGLSAPLMVLALMRRPDFAHGAGFIVWNLLGLLDFVGAAGSATLASGAIAGMVDGALTSAAMEVWPLSLFPAFIVPLFAFLHFTVLLQAFAARRRHGAAQAR